MSMAFASCQSASSAAQQEQQPQAQKSQNTGAHQRTVNAKDGVQGATSSVKTAMRRSTDAMPSPNVQQQLPHSKKRLSLPFQRPSQVVASTITNVDIYYGSLTGTAARFAALLAKDVAARGVTTTLRSLEQFDEHLLVTQEKKANTHASVFVVSTHFAGGAPPSAEDFYQWLRLVSGKANKNHAVRSPRGSIPTLEEPTTKTLAKLTLGKDTTKSVAGIADGSAASSSTCITGSSPMRLLLNWSRDFGKKKRPREKSLLEGMQFAVFGVGSSIYLTYNAMGKFVDARMHTLGAIRLCSLGLGDIAEDAEATFLKWKAQFLQQLPIIPHNTRFIAFDHDLVGLPPQYPPHEQQQQRHIAGSSGQMQQRQLKDATSLSSIQEDPLATTMKTMVVDRYSKHVRLRFRCRTIDKPAAASRHTRSPPRACTKSFGAPDDVAMTRSPKHSLHLRKPSVGLQSISLLLPDYKTTTTSKTNSRDKVVPTDNQLETRKEIALVRLALLDHEMEYETADIFGYLPHNCAETVESVASRLGFKLDTWIELYFETTRNKQYQKHHLPFTTPCTVRTALTEFLELQTVSREFVRVASKFVAEARERDALEHLASMDGSTTFNEQFVKQKKGILELFELAPSLSIPFEVFVSITPLIKPRLFSIACSHLKHPEYIELAVDLGRPDQKHGVSVTHLRELMTMVHNTKSSIMLRGFVSPSPFKIPEDTTTPMIMIANGIGIAPMRALLEHRKLEFEKLKEGNCCRTPPRNLLFFGCRDSSSILFAEELRAWERGGFLVLKLAYSAEDGRTGQYVQDVVALHLSEIAELTKSSSDARIYVSGKSAMTRSVREVLRCGLQHKAGNGRHWFDKVVESGRYVEDAF